MVGRVGLDLAVIIYARWAPIEPRNLPGGQEVNALITFDVRLITTPHYIFQRLWITAAKYYLCIAGLHYYTSEYECVEGALSLP